MTPFLLTIEFATPPALSVSGRTPTLDAVLFGEIATNLELAARDAGAPVVPHARPVLDAMPLAVTDGAYHASSLFLSGSISKRTLAKFTNRSCHIQHSLIRDDVAPDPGTRGFTISNARFRNDLGNDYRVTTARAGTFAGIGDIDRIAAIFDQIFAIGPRRAEGFGEVADYRIEAIAHTGPAWGLLDHACQPVRPIPLPLWQKISRDAPVFKSIERAAPPYWSSETPKVVCVTHPQDYQPTWLEA